MSARACGSVCVCEVSARVHVNVFMRVCSFVCVCVDRFIRMEGQTDEKKGASCSVVEHLGGSWIGVAWQTHGVYPPGESCQNTMEEIGRASCRERV